LVPSTQTPDEVTSNDAESFNEQGSLIEEADGLGSLIHQTEVQTTDNPTQNKMTYSQWFVMPQLYQIAVIYLSTR